MLGMIILKILFAKSKASLWLLMRYTLLSVLPDEFCAIKHATKKMTRTFFMLTNRSVKCRLYIALTTKQRITLRSSAAEGSHLEPFVMLLLFSCDH